MAKMLIVRSRPSSEPQKLHDGYRENLRQISKPKSKVRSVETPEAHIASGHHIMEALKKKPGRETHKPAQVATSAAPPPLAPVEAADPPVQAIQPAPAKSRPAKGPRHPDNGSPACSRQAISRAVLRS